MVICLERGADFHMFQLMPLPLTISCFSKIQIGFTFLVPAHPGSPGKRAVKNVCVCVCVSGTKNFHLVSTMHSAGIVAHLSQVCDDVRPGTVGLRSAAVPINRERPVVGLLL